MDFRNLINKMALIKETSTFDNEKRIDEISQLINEKISSSELREKFYSRIPEDVFEEIVAADPTRKPDGSPGRYTKWLLKIYMAKKLKLEDLYKATEYLTFFKKYGGKLEKRDINQYETLPQLYNALKHIIDSVESGSEEYMSNSEREAEAKKGSVKDYEDSEWVVIIPKTKEASCYYGANTQWCTAARKDNKFDQYAKDGDLLIIINKSSGDKYQFHIETSSYMDSSDDDLSFPLSETLEMNNELIEYLKGKGVDPTLEMELGDYHIYDMENPHINVGEHQIELPYIPDDNDHFRVLDGEGELSDYEFYSLRKKGKPQYVFYFNTEDGTQDSFVFPDKIYSIDVFHNDWLLMNNTVFMDMNSNHEIKNIRDYECVNHENIFVIVFGDTSIVTLEYGSRGIHDYPDGTDFDTWKKREVDEEDGLVIELRTASHIARLDIGNYADDWEIIENTDNVAAD